ncbi:MAG TPA: hypothetical protein VFZ21_04305 [Gemmatimonadaceae bacterium]|nr:hypothetical protein [Gemmatimonadaceae bacterium]
MTAATIHAREPARGAVPTVVSWSGGKDSALALHALLMDPTVDVRGLLTTITDAYDRVSMHGVRAELVAQQASAVGLELFTARIPPHCTNERYEAVTVAALAGLRETGIRCVAFGDLFLADVRAYRERVVSAAGLEPVFPLWGRPTARLAREFVAAGFRAVLACVDPRQLDVSRCGIEFDDALLDALPRSVDPCGEHGEFHTFVYDGPMFERSIAPRPGELVERDGFVFRDLLPGDATGATSGDVPRGGMSHAS